MADPPPPVQLTADELKAAEIVRNLLERHGPIALSTLLGSDTSTPGTSSATQTPPTSEAVLPALLAPPATIGPFRPLPPMYLPPPASPFTAEEIEKKHHSITRQTDADRMVKHPKAAIVEYPECGATKEEIIFHRFTIDPSNFIHPRDNIQYSLSSDTSNGGHHNRRCNWLTPDGNTATLASRQRVSCTEHIYTCGSSHTVRMHSTC